MSVSAVNGGVGKDFPTATRFEEKRLMKEIQQKNCENSEDERRSSLKETPRSASDYKFTLSPRAPDTDSEILDLDGYDLTDDDESWLYSSPSAGNADANSDDVDISLWLRKDADNLDPLVRRALVEKLENYLKKKTNSTTLVAKDERTPQVSIKVVSNVENNQISSNPEPTPTRFGTGIDDGLLEYMAIKNSDLNPDLKDIQLLASLQEQNLRQCLQQLQLTNRRRVRSENPDKLGTSPKILSAHNNVEECRVKSPKVVSPLEESKTKTFADLSSTYVKSNFPTKSAVTPQTFVSSKSMLRHTAPPPTGPKPTTSTGYGRRSATPAELKKVSSKNISATFKHVGLRKSLPNLAASLSSEFSLPTSTNDTASEKGSYGDIPNVLSPATSSQKIGDSRRSSNSRLPIPSSRIASARGSLSAPKSGIPVPRSRAKSPAPKLSLQTRLVDRYNNWNDGCM